MIKNKSIVSNNGLDVGTFNLVNTKDSPNVYYDKRLIQIFQVPQMPYLEKIIITGKWQPTKEAIKAVKAGKLFIEKKGQKYVMNDSNLNQKNSNKLHISPTDILTVVSPPEKVRLFYIIIRHFVIEVPYEFIVLLRLSTVTIIWFFFLCFWTLKNCFSSCIHS